jgi:hypothetical protein
VSIFFAKSLPKMFWSKGNKNLSASSPGQATYKIEISGCYQKKKLPSGKRLFLFVPKKLAETVFAN